MKRTQLLAWAGAAALLLAGCAAPADEIPATQPPTVTQAASLPTQDPDAYREQLSLIWEQRELWRTPDEYDGWCYTVTDLDQNGQLELFRSEDHGTGHVLTTYAWEVRDNQLCSIAAPDEQLEGPNFCSTFPAEEGPEPVTAFYDAETGTRYYIQYHTSRTDAATYLETQSAVSLKDGVLSSQVLATKESLYSDQGVTVICQNTAGAPLSEEEYQNAAATHFAALQPQTVQTQWLTCVPAQELIFQQLEACLAAFSIAS